jgi:orotidine-5'-phosphate decarboxylase
MGFDTLDPFIKACETRGAGLFALVKTSNPGSGDFQDKKLDDGRLVYEAIADRINDYNSTHRGDCGYGPVGMVVGATYPDQLSSLRKRCPATWILVPGYGAQGGTAADIAGAFDSNGLGAVVNSSRDILFAFRKKKLPDADYAAAAKDAAQTAARDLNPFK